MPRRFDENLWNSDVGLPHGKHEHVKNLTVVQSSIVYFMRSVDHMLLFSVLLSENSALNIRRSSSGDLIAWSTRPRRAPKVGLDSGAANGEDLPKSSRTHETCERCRNPAAGYRPLFLARGLAVRLAFCANRCWRNVNRAPPATCSARCLIKIMHSHLHIREHRLKLAPDRGFKFDLPRPQKPCEYGSRNGWGRSGRRIPDAGGAWQYVPCRILQTSAFS